MRREIKLGERLVQCRGQVEGGIYQCAIKIEDHRPARRV
jgi:hypothetical protein